MKNTTIFSIGLISAILLAGFLFYDFNEGPTVTVYKSPTCKCCVDWVDHLEENGFETKIENVNNTVIVKNKFEIGKQLQACHTAVVDGYIVEGHVPADLVKRMLNEEPDIKGIAVPGMPQGSPGMEGSGVKEPYTIYTFDEDGNTGVYAKR